MKTLYKQVKAGEKTITEGLAEFLLNCLFMLFLLFLSHSFKWYVKKLLNQFWK